MVVVYRNLHRVRPTYSLGRANRMVRSLAVILLYLLASTVQAQEASSRIAEPEKNTARLYAFLTELQKSVAIRDRAAVMSVIQFPVQSGPGGEMISHAQFVAAY